MKNLIYPLAALLIICTSAVISMSSQEYKLKDGYEIRFDSKDPSGVFEKMEAKINFDENDLANSSFKISIDVNSISTGNGMKNKKAMTSEWFNAAKYPEITFISTKIEKDEKGYRVHGNLKIKGVSKFRKIPLKVVKSGSDTKFTGIFWVDRAHYKVGKPSQTVPDKLKITYDIPVTKK